jgi:hypothetical protein
MQGSILYLIPDGNNSTSTYSTGIYLPYTTNPPHTVKTENYGTYLIVRLRYLSYIPKYWFHLVNHALESVHRCPNVVRGDSCAGPPYVVWCPDADLVLVPLQETSDPMPAGPVLLEPVTRILVTYLNIKKKQKRAETRDMGPLGTVPY